MKNRKAFTMVELVFVIVVIGILSAVAIPKLAATRDDAEITVGINTVSSVRNAIATERQKRILRGDFTPITDLDADGVSGTMFSTFSADSRTVKNKVLEYPVKEGSNTGEWSKSNTEYTFHFTGGSCTFVLNANTFQLKTGTRCAWECIHAFSRSYAGRRNAYYNLTYIIQRATTRDCPYVPRSLAVRGNAYTYLMSTAHPASLT